VHEDHLLYCAARGSSSKLNGTSAPIGATLSDLLRAEAAQQPAIGSRLEAPQNRGTSSPIFFPIHHEGKIAALLQLSFPETESIQEQERHSCQVMAGLMGEAIARAAEAEWKQMLATERATMLEALEQLRPQLERLTSEAPQGTAATETAATAKEPVAQTVSVPGPELPGDMAELQAELAAGLAQLTAPHIEADEAKEPATIAELAQSHQPALSASETPTPTPASPVKGTESDVLPSAMCERCGHPFGASDMFCGRCGTPRTMELLFPTEPSIHSQGESALPEEANDSKIEQAETPATTQAQFEESSLKLGGVAAPAVLEPAFGPFAEPAVATAGTSALAIDREPARLDTVQDADQKGKLEIVREFEKPTRPSPWASAVRARQWLESLPPADSPARIWLARHSGDLSVALAATVLLFALAGWGTHPARNAAQSKTPPPPALSLFERMLVSLGVAEPPPAQVYMGNPNVQVWVDLHTGLYYCTGSDLYGQTPGGKFTSQRDAQLDQFQPAARKNCE
jgi:hypothetical protein